MASDGELLDQWRGGDHEAFASLYGRHRRQIYLYLLGIVREEETAEDLLQETFVRILRRSPALLRRLRAGSSLRPYLAAVARNQATDWLRRSGRDHRAREEIGHARLLSQRTSYRPSELSPEEAGELLWQLPPQQREVLILKIYLGLTFAEIARVTRSSQNTATSRYRYGLEKIRDALEEVHRGTETDL